MGIFSPQAYTQTLAETEYRLVSDEEEKSFWSLCRKSTVARLIGLLISYRLISLQRVISITRAQDRVEFYFPVWCANFEEIVYGYLY